MPWVETIKTNQPTSQCQMLRYNCLRESDQKTIFFFLEGLLCSWRVAEGKQQISLSNGDVAQCCGHEVNQTSEDRRVQSEWWENNPIYTCYGKYKYVVNEEKSASHELCLLLFWFPWSLQDLPGLAALNPEGSYKCRGPQAQLAVTVAW